MLKIEPSEITSFFYNIFPISGGGVPYVPPGSAYDEDASKHEKIFEIKTTILILSKKPINFKL